MVSVIVAVYNIEEYVDKCILSILSQTYSNLEIIIIDDGSTDKTGKICLKYVRKDPRIKYIKQGNKGQGEARNIGLKMAKGEYVTYVDGDDWLETDAIEKMYHAAQREDADIVVGDIWYVYYNQNEMTKRYSKVRYDNFQVIKCGECPEKMSRLRTFTWGKLYRKEFLQKEKFTQPSRAYEDTATIPILLLHAKKIVYINTPVYNYLKTRNTSTIYNTEKVKDLLEALQQLYSVFDKEKYLKEYEMEIKRLFWGQIRSLCIAHGISWDHIDRAGSNYKKLISFISQKFNNFVFLDNCEITVFNSVMVEQALKNLVISDCKICHIEDKNNRKSRIVIKQGQKIREYNLEKKYISINIEDENQIWNCADDLFDLIQREG